jgi:hypothetical protein
MILLSFRFKEFKRSLYVRSRGVGSRGPFQIEVHVARTVWYIAKSSKPKFHVRSVNPIAVEVIFFEPP